MNRRLLLPALMMSMVFLSSTLLAEEKCAKCPLEAGKECSACPIKTAMKNFPKITYAVGKETTCCEKSANKLALEQSAPIVYLVEKEKFEDANEAKLALVTATEAFVVNFANPHVCKVSGTTTIAGQKTECSKTAAKLTVLVTSAMKNVRLTYAVGDEACDCPHAAASLAKSSGKPKLFVVGEEKTECEVTARLNLALAQYRAMVKAIVEAEKKTEAVSEES